MPLRLSTPEHKNGLRLFVAGTLLYFASWLALIAAPDSAWARSAAGFLAPAYTPLPWLLGLAFMGRQLFWGQFYRWWMHLGLSLLFLAAHLSHAALVYVRHY